MLWPNRIITWNYWTERRFRAHCENHKFITWAGGSNIGKSEDAACLMIMFWLSSPREHTGLVGSTTLTASESRMWGYLKQKYIEDSAIALPGKLFLSSPARIVLSKTDTIHGIFAVPLINSKTSRSSSDLIGRHPKQRMFVVIDEGPDVPPGFMDAESNWEKSPWFQCLILGNSSKMTDPHGILSQPKIGWDKINPDIDTEWETKKGICLYFDCYQSPAIFEKNAEKRKALEVFLFTKAKIQKSIADHGENSPHHWRMTRGFWAPSDITKTVLTLVDIDKHKARDKAHWSGRESLIKLGSLDAAFTAQGDAIVLAFGTLGEEVSGRQILEFNEKIYLRFDVTSADPIEYQLVEQVRKEFAKRQIEPSCFALDVTGSGTGLGSVFEKEWSRHVMKIDSRGECSEDFMDMDKQLTAKDLYDRKATELVFMLQRFVRSGQIRNLNPKSIEQITTREWLWKGKKISIEKKEDYKLRMGRVDSKYRSPDEMDTDCLIIELARKRFGFLIDAQKHRPIKSGLRKFLDYQGQMNPSEDIPGKDIPGKDYVDGATLSNQFSHPSTWGDSFLEPQSYEEES